MGVLMSWDSIWYISILKSFVISDDGSEISPEPLIDVRITQSASKNRALSLGIEPLARSKTCIGTSLRLQQENAETEEDIEYLADVKLEKPALPAPLYFTRGDGNFITGFSDGIFENEIFQ